MKNKIKKITVAVLIVALLSVVTVKIIVPFIFAGHAAVLIDNHESDEKILATVNKGMVFSETNLLKFRLSCMKPACFDDDLTVYDDYEKNMKWDKNDPYDGEWNNGIKPYEKGFTSLIVSDCTDDSIEFSYICVSPENKNYISILHNHIAQIKDNVATVHFDEDGWGNSGELKMTFSEDTVKVTVDFEKKAAFAKWGIQESELEFYFND